MSSSNDPIGSIAALARQRRTRSSISSRTSSLSRRVSASGAYCRSSRARSPCSTATMLPRSLRWGSAARASRRGGRGRSLHREQGAPRLRSRCRAALLADPAAGRSSAEALRQPFHGQGESRALLLGQLRSRLHEVFRSPRAAAPGWRAELRRLRHGRGLLARVQQCWLLARWWCGRSCAWTCSHGRTAARPRRDVKRAIRRLKADGALITCARRR